MTSKWLKYRRFLIRFFAAFLACLITWNAAPSSAISSVNACLKNPVCVGELIDSSAGAIQSTQAASEIISNRPEAQILDADWVDVPTGTKYSPGVSVPRPRTVSGGRIAGSNWGRATSGNIRKSPRGFSIGGVVRNVAIEAGATILGNAITGAIFTAQDGYIDDLRTRAQELYCSANPQATECGGVYDVTIFFSDCTALPPQRTVVTSVEYAPMVGQPALPCSGTIDRWYVYSQSGVLVSYAYPPILQPVGQLPWEDWSDSARSSAVSLLKPSDYEQAFNSNSTTTNLNPGDQFGGGTITIFDSTNVTQNQGDDVDITIDGSPIIFFPDVSPRDGEPDDVIFFGAPSYAGPDPSPQPGDSNFSGPGGIIRIDIAPSDILQPPPPPIDPGEGECLVIPGPNSSEYQLDCDVEFVQQNFLSYAISQFQSKFPLDIFGEIPTTDSSCPTLEFFSYQYEFCWARDFLDGSKWIIWIAFLIRSVLSL